VDDGRAGAERAVVRPLEADHEKPEEGEGATVERELTGSS